MVGEGQGDHGFDHGHGAGEDARVVATASADRRIFEVAGDCFLFVHDGGDRLEGDAEVDGHTVANAALDSAAVVGGGDGVGSIGAADGVVVFKAGKEGAGVSGADFEPL